MQSGYRLYICSTCVGEVHCDILDNCSTHVEEPTINSHCPKLNLDNTNSDTIVKESSFQSISMSTQTTTTFKTIEQQIEENKKMENELKTKLIDLQRVYDEKTKLRNENLHQKSIIEKLTVERSTLDQKMNVTKKHLDKKTLDVTRVLGDNKMLQSQINRLRDEEDTLRSGIEDRDKMIKDHQAKTINDDENHIENGIRLPS